MKNDPVPGFSLTDGTFVQVGTDSEGRPLFQSIEAVAFPTAALADEHSFGRPARPGTRKSNVGAIAVQIPARPVAQS